MTELEKIAYAKTFIDKLANGIDPINDTPVKEDDVINNVRLSRCFFYVSEVLNQVIENGGVNPPARVRRERFSLSAEAALAFEYSAIPLPVSEIAKRISALKAGDNMRNLSAQSITNWLVEIGVLYVQRLDEKTTVKRPTDEGIRLGITTEIRSGQYGTYTAVLYSAEAQRFIVDNVEAIVAASRRRKSE
ncbi:MAG: hypothetical protein IJO81_05305 [Clostridia bacterium]|nr:hypothetical protein [Clostridia bacterium]